MAYQIEVLCNLYSLIRGNYQEWRPTKPIGRDEKPYEWATEREAESLKGGTIARIDADELVLYKVALPYAKDFEGLASQALKVELDSPLSELSEIFPKKPTAKVVSILVEVPVISE